MRNELQIAHHGKRSRKRGRPTALAQQFILKTQKDRCFYCGLKLLEWYHDGKFARQRDIHWDHVSPWSYTRNNNNDNFVAACRECNGIKSAKVFTTLEEAANHVRERRKKKKLPINPIWGNSRTQKLLAAKLFHQSFTSVINKEITSDASSEDIQAHLDELQSLRKLLRKM